MKIVSCKCKHSFQDKEYGQQQRAANLCTKKGKVGDRIAHKCTVCGTLHNI